MKRLSSFLLFLVVLAVGVSACQSGAAQVAPTATARPTMTRLPTLPSTPVPTATVTPTPPAARAAQVLGLYLEAVRSEDFITASEWLSDFSLLVPGLSRRQVRNLLADRSAQGQRLLRYRLGRSQEIDARTTLIAVTLSMAGEEKEREELWALRLEDGDWRVNWERLIAYEVFAVADKSYDDVVIKPVQLLRYTDRTRLELMVQNLSGQTVTWGGKGMTNAVFYFGDQKVAVTGAAYQFNPRRGYDVAVEAPGLYLQALLSVELLGFGNASRTPRLYRFDLR